MNAKSAIPKLQDLINTEKDSAVIITAAHSLIQLGDPILFNVYYADLTGERKFGQGLLEEQLKMLNDPRKMARIGFEQAIGLVPFGGISYTAFKMIRKGSVSAVRAAAAKVLADNPDPKTAEALVNAATSDKSWLVRDAALDAISHRGDPTLSSRIVPALNDNKSIVRYTAAAAIIHLADIKSANRASTN